MIVAQMRLQFEEIDQQFLAGRPTGLRLVFPIGDRKPGRRRPGAEHSPVIVHPERVLPGELAHACRASEGASERFLRPGERLLFLTTLAATSPATAWPVFVSPLRNVLLKRAL